MTTYEKFIESKTKLVDDAILCEYRIYLTNCEVNPDGSEHYTIENSEEWFVDTFVDYLNYTIDYGEYDFDFEYFDSNNIYKQLVCKEYYDGRYSHHDERTDFNFYEDHEDINALVHQIRQARNDKNDTISMNFYTAYVNKLTFEDFKTLLYENGIYNDIFADQIDLK